MKKEQRREAKRKRREQVRRAERQRRIDADRCARLLYEASLAWDIHRDAATTRRLLEKVLQIRPHHAAAREHLAEVEFATGHLEAGWAHYVRLSGPPEWPVLTYQAAVACFRAGRWDRCGTLLREFLRRTGRQPEFRELRTLARALSRACAKEGKRAARAVRAAPAAGELPLLRAIDAATTAWRAGLKPGPHGGGVEATSSRAGRTELPSGPGPDAGEATPERATAVESRGAASEAEAVLDLPPFPDVEVPPIEMRVEVEPAELAASDGPMAVAPVREVLLRRDYATLRLQKGFDELVSLEATSGVARFRYQIETVRRILRDFRGRALLADEVGLGKTIEAGLALKEYWMRGLVRKALVLTPPSLVSQWVDELSSKFGLTPATPDATRGRGEDLDGFWVRHPLVVASLPLARQAEHRARLAAIDYDLIVVDEAHVLKRRTSAAWQLVGDLKTRFLLLLSATPVGNDLSELYNLILLLRPGLLKTETHFRREYGRLHALDEPARRDKLRALLREVMVRNTRAHIDLKLPRRLAATLVVQPGPGEAEVLDALAAYIRDRYPHAAPAERWRLMTLQMQAGSSPAALGYGLRDRDGAPGGDGLERVADNLARLDGVSAKTKALIDLARRSPEKKIVFTRFLATLDELRQALETEGFEVAVFHGGLTAAAKDAAIAHFADRAEVLLASEIGGEGRNLQFCHTVINYDLPWNPMTIEQRVGRVHRIGQTREVYVFNLCLAGSIEQHILAILHDKINLFELVAGEIEMILGHLDEEADFATIVMDLWARGAAPGEQEHAFGELSARITDAKARYLKTRELDHSLFSEDYEV